jgi:hypothetical protein
LYFTITCHAHSISGDGNLLKAIADIFGLKGFKVKPFKLSKSKFYVGIRGDIYFQNAYYLERTQQLKTNYVLPVTVDNSGLFVGYRFYKNYYVEAGVYQYSLSMANGILKNHIDQVDQMPVTSYRYPIRLKYQLEISAKRVYFNPFGGLIWSVNSIRGGYGRDPVPDTSNSRSFTHYGTIDTDYAINFGNTFMQELGQVLNLKYQNRLLWSFCLLNSRPSNTDN